MISETAYDAMSAELQRLREENAEMRTSLIRLIERSKAVMSHQRARREGVDTMLSDIVSYIERRFIGAKEVANG
jgi:hypothetical protein